MNKAILMGNVGADPKMRYVQTRLVAEFSLATNEPAYTTPAGVQIPERTEWHNIVLWRGLAEVVEKYVKKGMRLYIEGRLRTRAWEDQTGIKRYTTEIYADNMQMLSRSDDAAGMPRAAAPTSPASPAAAPQTASPMPADEGDDLPF